MHKSDYRCLTQVKTSLAIKPVTLSDLVRANKLMWTYSRDCYRECDLDPASILLPSDYSVSLVGTRMHCTRCGSRKIKIEMTPELHPSGIVAMRSR